MALSLLSGLLALAFVSLNSRLLIQGTPQNTHLQGGKDVSGLTNFEDKCLDHFVDRLKKSNTLTIAISGMEAFLPIENYSICNRVVIKHLFRFYAAALAKMEADVTEKKRTIADDTMEMAKSTETNTTSVFRKILHESGKYFNGLLTTVKASINGLQMEPNNTEKKITIASDTMERAKSTVRNTISVFEKILQESAKYLNSLFTTVRASLTGHQVEPTNTDKKRTIADDTMESAKSTERNTTCVFDNILQESAKYLNSLLKTGTQLRNSIGTAVKSLVDRTTKKE